MSTGRISTTLYVDTAGSDEYDGQAPETAVNTIQRAIDLSYGIIGDVVIQIADGDYPNTNAIAKGGRQGTLEITGNVERPEKVRIDSGFDPLSAATIWAVEGAVVSVKGLHISATSEQSPLFASCLRATYNGVILTAGPIIFGPAAYTHLLAGNGRIIVNHGYAVEGGAQFHVFSSTGSAVATTAQPDQRVHLIGTPHFSGAFACAQTLSVINWRLPFIGDVTGMRHIINDAGCIALNSIGSDSSNTPDEMPGDAEGKNISGFYNGHVHGVNL